MTARVRWASQRSKHHGRTQPLAPGLGTLLFDLLTEAEAGVPDTYPFGL
jgi:hypothetical protein